MKDLDKDFSNFCDKKMFKLNISKNLIIFLKKITKKKKFFISTGTPHKKINQIIKQKKIKKFFKGIYGSPAKRSLILIRLFINMEIKVKLFS